MLATNIRQAFLTAACLIFAMEAAAQSTVTSADIERARARNAAPSEADVAAIARKYASVPVSNTTPSTPRVDSLPQPAARAPDLAAVAAGYSASAREMLTAAQSAPGPTLHIFLTLSMPEPTIDRLLDQAARAKAVVSLRGLEGGSMRATLVHVQRLIGKRQVSVQIDPQAFDRYAIQAVPAFVLAAPNGPCGAAICPSSGFVKAAGDVSLEYALDRFAQVPLFAGEARQRLSALRGRP